MSSTEYLVSQEPVPHLNIPSSSSTVSVSIIDSTSHIEIPLSVFLEPPIKGHTHLRCPALSFRITHPSNRTLLFDLGVRKDWQNLSPRIVSRIRDGGWSVSVEHHVSELLQHHSINPSAIESIIWSHYHWDHTGAPATFPPSTSLTVGPGFSAAFLPGYPPNPDSPVLEEDFANRALHELSFANTPLRIGGFAALDFFADGSFYLLDVPGHAIGHMCGLARVTSTSSSASSSSTASDTFILMGADACHHGAEFRPSPYIPLPKTLSPCPLPRTPRGATCPGSLFQAIHPTKSATQPFYGIKEGFAHDKRAAEDSIRGIQRFDASEDVWVVIAHDDSLVGSGVEFFPGRADAWRERGWKEEVRWRFLGDFAEAVEEGRGEGEA